MVCVLFLALCTGALFCAETLGYYWSGFSTSHLPPFLNEESTAHTNSDMMQTPQNIYSYPKCFPVVVTPALFPVFVLLMRQTALLELFRVLLPAFRTILGASFKFRRVLPVSLAARAQANGTRTKSL